MTSGLAGSEFYLFPESVNDWIYNVKINYQLKCSGGHPSCQLPTSVNLGILGQGYHLLEFEFDEQLDWGILRFHVATASGQHAWLSRFRIYVPNYSNDEYEYMVQTSTRLTYLPYEYFLIGYADDYIANVSGGVHYWPDWEWDCIPYKTIYAWGDGFCYPLGPMQMERNNFSFTFGNNGSGLLDFQMISWSFQKERIGPPKFYAEGSLHEADHITTDNGVLMGGSMWKDDSDPEFSERFFEARQMINASYNDGSIWFDTAFEIGIGVGWSEWALLPGAEDDMGITLNLTCKDFRTNANNDGIIYWILLSLQNPEIDIYTFPDLEIKGIEYMEHDSFVTPGLISAIDYCGTCIMFSSSILSGPTPTGLVGSLVGFLIKAIATGLRVHKDQEVSRFTTKITGTHHYDVLRNDDFEVCTPPRQENRNNSDVIFFKLNPGSGKHCGLTIVNLHGTLVAKQWYRYGFAPLIAPIASISITLCIPWFLRG